jgi:Zn-dependent protease with chaperone function
VNFDACLAAYALTAALAAPVALGRLAADGMPRLGVAAWLLAAVSVVLSWLAVGVSLAFHPGRVAPAIGVAVLVGLAGRLIWAGATTWTTTRSRRVRHVLAATLLGRRDPVTGAVVVDSPELVAYCLPHGRDGLVVVTTGARDALSADELDAVLAHERAHLVGHHHLLMGLGQVLARALPLLALFRELSRQVPRLLEMRADDAAARIHGPRTVATAIARMSSAATPVGVLGAGGPAAAARALRLTGPPATSVRGRVALAVTGVALVTGPLLATLPACPHPW